MRLCLLDVFKSSTDKFNINNLKNEYVTDVPLLPDGNVIVIRFIRSNRKLDIFGEKFIMPKELVYSYVKAVIVTAIHSVQVYLGEELIEFFPYEMPPKIFG